jgi:hypothetical protein
MIEETARSRRTEEKGRVKVLTYRVKANRKEPFVRVTMAGSIKREPGLRAVEDAVREAERRQATSIMVDARKACNGDSPIEQYCFASQLGETGLARSTKIAFVTAPGDESHRIFEVITNNHGYLFRLFNEESIAISWLQQ